MLLLRNPFSKKFPRISLVQNIRFFNLLRPENISEHVWKHKGRLVPDPFRFFNSVGIKGLGSMEKIKLYYLRIFNNPFYKIP